MANFLQNGLFNWLVLNVEGGPDLAWWFLRLGFYILCIFLPYLLGSISSAVIVSRVLFHDDVRKYGSKNAGLTNMFRVYGVKGALPTLLGDILKSALAVAVGGILFGFYYIDGFAFGGAAYLSGAFCVIGHIFPLFYQFRGGKGVLCAVIAVAILNTWVAAILFLVFVIMVSFTKYVSLGSCVAAGLYPVFLAAVIRGVFPGQPMPIQMLLFSFFIAGIIAFAHRANLRRLWNHEESRFSFHRSYTPSDSSDGNESKR